MGEVSSEASMMEPRGAWEQSRSTIAVVPADSKPDKELLILPQKYS
jgi:hypothetical protein